MGQPVAIPHKNTLAEDAGDWFLDLKRANKLRRSDMAEWSRADVNTFAEWTLDLEQQPLHVDFHARCDANPFQVLYSPPEHAKTFQLGLVRQLWEAGNDQNLHQAHISSTADIPEGNLDQLAKQVAHNKRVQEVFPSLRITRGPVHNKRGVYCLWFQRSRDHTDRDPSIIAIGQRQQVMGRRLDRVLLDDVLDFDSTYTKTQTQKTIDRMQLEVVGRFMAESRGVYIGHPWRKGDMGQWLAAHGWDSHRYDVMAGVDGAPGPPGLWPKEVRDPKTGKLYGWPWERILARKGKVDPLMWLLQWRCIYPDDGTELFSTKALMACLENGRGLAMGHQPPEGVQVVSGIDLSTGSATDEAVITTIYSVGGRIYVTDIRGGLWDEPRFWREIRDVLRAYPNHAGFMLETNGMQQWMRETTERPAVMRAYGWNDEDIRRARWAGRTTTKQNKMHPGDPQSIRGLAIDVGNHQVALPSDEDGNPHPVVAKLIKGMEDVDPMQPGKHTSDYLISYWEAVEMLRRAGLGGFKRARIS